MTRKRKLVLGGVAALALGGGAVGIAQAVGGDSDERVTGPAADRAGSAALRAVPGGRVVSVERGDERGDAWEVEVARPDGSQVEVHLNRSLAQRGVERDDDGEGDREGD